MTNYAAPVDGRPLPHPTELSAPHWNGANERRLMVQQCAACAGYTFPPRAVCGHCFSDRLDWMESSGKGVVHSFTIIHRAPHPSFTTPYCAAIIALSEGWYMVSNVVGTEMNAISVGMPVLVEYLSAGDQNLPVFRAATDAG